MSVEGGEPDNEIACTVVSCKYASPFATLASVQNTGGGLYTGCGDFSRDYAPLPVPVKHDLPVAGGVKAKREASPSARQRDAPDATD